MNLRGFFHAYAQGQRALSFHRCLFCCGKDRRELIMDCFAVNEDGKCTIHGVGKCQGGTCHFCKTGEEQAQSLEKVSERLRSLPEYQQEAIADKYYGGVKKW